MSNTYPVISNGALTVVSRTATTISVKWQKASDNESPAEELEYLVTWCVSPYVWDNKVRKMGEWIANTDSYTIKGLKPGTKYDIIVYVRDPQGADSMYAITTIDTLTKELPDNPPVIPNKIVSIDNIRAGSMTIRWQSATDQETARKDLKYYVVWTPGPDYADSNAKISSPIPDIINKKPRPGMRVPLKSRNNSYTITGLFPNRSYKVTVLVSDGVNTSAYSPLYATTSESDPDPVDNSKAIRDLLASVPYSETALINNDLYDDKTNYPDAIESLPDRDAAFLLTKKETPITKKEIYVRGSGYQNIYPGALLLVDTDLTTGSPTPLANVKRNKISIFGDFLAGSTTTQDDVEANNSAVSSAVNRIMETLLKDSRYEAPGMQTPRTRIHSSQKSLMLDLKVDSSFAGVNVNVNAKTNTSEQTFIHATTLEQDYFTVKLKDTWLQDPSTLFDKSVTTEQLRKAMNGKALAIVTSVTYGRTFSYLREYSAKAVKVDSSQKVSAYGTNVDASENYSSSESYQNSEIFNLGGTSLSKSVLEGKKTQEEIEKAMANNMQFSRNNQGVVTKYTIQLVTSTTPGKPIRPLFNGKLYQIGYVRCPRKLSAYVNVGPVRIGGSGGGDVRVFLEVQCFRVVNGKPVIFKTVDMHSPRKIVWDWYYTCNKTATHIYGDLNEGEYIFKNPTLRVQSRASKVSDWTTDDTKLLNHGEIESGEIELYLDGDVCSSVKIIEIKS